MAIGSTSGAVVQLAVTSFTCLDGPQQVDAAQVLSLDGQSNAQLSVSLALSSPGSYNDETLLFKQPQQILFQLFRTSVNSG